MNGEKRAEEKIRILGEIELDKVLSLISSYSLFPETKPYFSFDLFSSEQDEIFKRRKRVGRYISFLEGEREISSFPPVADILSELEDNQIDLSGDKIYILASFLKSYVKLLEFDEREAEINDEWLALSGEVFSTLDVDGNVLPDHPLLKELRRELDEKKRKRREYTSSFIRENEDLVMSSTPSFHSGRMLFQIKSMYRNKVPGYVEGESGSGKALYIEPFQLVDLNNDVSLAEARIENRIRKILRDFSVRMKSLLPSLRSMRRDVISFDLYYSFAAYMKKMKGKACAISDVVSIVRGRHPLLSEPVPIDLKIKKGVKGVVLSGANAGGKTVSMKTLALLAALNQISGYSLLDEKSSLPVFSSILADIGDGQSIFDDESTFSAHMEKIRVISDLVDDDSLVILDELSSGTDPEEGSALALSILTYLKEHSRLVVVTSHYSSLKERAYADETLMNASMSFDEDNGKPTFSIIPDVPGESHALSTAKRKKLPEKIINDAYENLKGKKGSVASLISKLMDEKRELESLISLQKEELRKVSDERKKLEEERDKVKRRELELDRTSLDEYSKLLREGRREVESIIKGFSGGKNREEAKIHRERLSELSEKEKEERARLDASDVEEKRDFSVGEIVLCGKMRKSGRILKKEKKNMFLVLLDGGVKMTIKGKDMVRKEEKDKGKKVLYDISSFSRESASYSLDLRGKTLEEAKEALSEEIDSALLSSLKRFEVIHGYGDGILMRGLHEYLKKRPEVVSYRFANPEDGGMGKTYVDLE